MKNRKGFTLVELLVVISIIILISLLLTPKITKITEENRKKGYKEIETRLKEASQKYILDNYIDSSLSNITLTKSQLINNNYIEEIKDLKDKSICDAHVELHKINNKYIFIPYLECSNYTTNASIVELTVLTDEGIINNNPSGSYNPDEIITLESITKPNAIFLGWEVIQGNSIISGNSLMIGTQNTTIKAKWIEKTELTLNLDNGITSQILEESYFSTTLITLEPPTKDKFTFSGWIVTSGNSTISGNDLTIGTQDTIVKAKWTAWPELTLNLDNGMTSQILEESYASGTSITLDPPTKPNAIFLGWEIEWGNSAISGNDLTIGTQDTIVKAKWTAEIYTITYNCNGGQGNTPSTRWTYGTTTLLTANRCYKITTGSAGVVYYFKGWAKTSTATSALFTNMQNIINTTEITSNTTLYAIWDTLFTITGNYEVVDESNGNWKIKIKGATGQTSGTAQMSVTKNINIEAFLVGGGGSGSSAAQSDDHTGGGGGGGYTKTGTANLSPDTTYPIVIGAGGASVSGATSGKQGGTTSAFALSAAGGNGGITITPSNKSGYSYCNGGNGGSGGAGTMGDKGTNGGNGTGAVTHWSEYTSSGGKGQNTIIGPNNESGSTREFGSATGTLYSDGGATGASGWTVVNNTGNGGTGSRNSKGLTTGASGIVVIRNAR